MIERALPSEVDTAVPERYRAERARVLWILERWRRSCNGETHRGAFLRRRSAIAACLPAVSAATYV